MHTKYQKAEKHSDSHKGDGRRGGEELPVDDAEVPHHSKHNHENGHHQAAGAKGYTSGSESPEAGSRSCSWLIPFLRAGLGQSWRDVAVDDTVVCNL